MTRNAHAYLGPMRSQSVPMTSLEKTLPETEATPALPMSVLVRFKLSLIIGTRGAAAKVDIKHVQNDIQLKWKVVIWGAAKEKRLNFIALCSESTGRANLAVRSTGTSDGETEKA